MLGFVYISPYADNTLISVEEKVWFDGSPVQSGSVYVEKKASETGFSGTQSLRRLNTVPVCDNVVSGRVLFSTIFQKSRYFDDSEAFILCW